MFRAPVVIGLTVVAALVRLATLDAQSFWYDEALTWELVNESFGGMLDGVFAHEAQPPPYFILAWLWVKVFGDGEIGLRSLSALFGTLTVPVAYEAARLVAGKRAAIAAGALTAFSPALVWYSQEARAYALVLFLCAVALLFFLRALDGWSRRDLVVWAVASVLATATHYFALFVLVPMALWVLLRGPGLRRVLPVFVGIGVGLLAILPMLLHQQEHGGVFWIGEIPLWPRVRDTVFFFAAGQEGVSTMDHHRDEVFAAGLVFFALCAAAAFLWSKPDVRRRLLLVVWVAGGFLALPYLASLVGSDYILERNLLPAWIPVTIVIAAGLCVPRLRWFGPAVVGAVCLAFAGVVLAGVPRNPERQRDDWEAVAKRIGPATEDRIVEVSPWWHARGLRIYMPGLDYTYDPWVEDPPADDPPRTVRKVYTVELETFVPYGQIVTTFAPPPPFKETLYARVQNMTVREYTAPEPVEVDPWMFRGSGRNRPDALFQPAAR